MSFADAAETVDAPKASFDAAARSIDSKPAAKKPPVIGPPDGPQFQTNDPAELRRQLAAVDPSAVAAFDRVMPGYDGGAGGGRGTAPASAYAQQPPIAAIAAPQATTPAKPRGDAGPDGSLHSALIDVPLSALWSMGSTIASGYAGLAGAALPGPAGQGADWARRTQQAIGTYEPPAGTDSAKMVEAFNSPGNPLNWIPNATTAGGKKLGDLIAGAGAPAAGALVAGAGAAAPMLLGIKGVRNGIGSAIGAGAEAIGFGDKPALPRIEPTMEPPLRPGVPRVDVVLNPARPPNTLNLEAVASGEAPQPLAPGMKVPTAQAPTRPPNVLNLDTVRPGVESPPLAPGMTVPEITPTDTLKNSLAPQPEHVTRAQVLKDVGFEQGREAAIQGNNRARAVEYQMGKFDEPAGQAAAKQFSDEQATLANYTQGLIKDVGGTVGMDQGSLYARGQAIVRPIQALQDWFDTQARGLYSAADVKAQGQPVSLGDFGGALKDQSFWTNSDRVHLKDAAISYAKKAGMQVGEDGSINGTALQAETVRKWLNQERTHANGTFVDALKESLDGDVGKAAGGPIYDQARALWSLRQRTLADPKGISALLDEEGTNRKIPFDRVPDKLAKMDQDQFAHIVGTLRDLPPEIQPVGQAALGEIKAQFLNRMLEDATSTRGGNARSFWNGTAVKNVLSENSGKLSTLLDDGEMQKVDTLRKAGDILSFDPSYPGAAAQAQNAVKSGLMSNLVGNAITGAGAAGGAMLGAPGAGAIFGRMAGDKAQTALGQSRALAGWQKKTLNLSDIVKGSGK